MNDPITTIEFNRLLHMAVDKYNLDPNSTYVEFTWWDGVFKPLICTDCDRKKNQFIMVFGGMIFAMSDGRTKMDMSFQQDSTYGKKQSP